MGVLEKRYFRGQSIHRLDAKGRLRIPTKFRDVLQNHYTDALIVTTRNECLVAYPPEVWDRLESKIRELSQVQVEQRAFIRLFVSGAEECEFDNQGRILIPPLLRDAANLDQDVLLAGTLESFEIWNKEAWDKHIAESKANYAGITAALAGIGL